MHKHDDDDSADDDDNDSDDDKHFHTQASMHVRIAATGAWNRL